MRRLLLLLVLLLVSGESRVHVRNGQHERQVARALFLGGNLLVARPDERHGVGFGVARAEQRLQLRAQSGAHIPFFGE